MKIPQLIFRLLILAAFLGLAAKVQAEDKPPVNPESVRSVFTFPAGPKEGRDPFFPESLRPFSSDVSKTVSTNQTVEITSLKVPGISGPPGHLLAIINTHTFAIGEEGDVRTASGPVHIRCLDIQENFVVVQINGQIHRINVESQ